MNIGLLGVQLRDDLKAADHMDSVLASFTRFRLTPFDCLGPKGLPALPSTKSPCQLPWLVCYTLLRPGGALPRSMTSQDSSGSKTKWRGWVTYKQGSICLTSSLWPTPGGVGLTPSNSIPTVIERWFHYDQSVWYKLLLGYILLRNSVFL